MEFYRVYGMSLSTVFLQVVRRVSMGSSVIRSVIVLITDAVIAHTERVCVTRACTDASAICVSTVDAF